MAEAILIKGGGGTGTGSDECTATKDMVLAGYTAVTQDSNDEAEAGTMPDKSGTIQAGAEALDSINNRVTLTVPALGRYSLTSKLYVTFAKLATLIGLTAAKIATGNTILGLAGTYKGLGNATAADVVSGKRFSTAALSNEVGTLPTKAGWTVTPTSAAQTLTVSGYKMTSNITVNGFGTRKYAFAWFSTFRALNSSADEQTLLVANADLLNIVNNHSKFTIVALLRLGTTTSVTPTASVIREVDCVKDTFYGFKTTDYTATASNQPKVKITSSGDLVFQKYQSVSQVDSELYITIIGQ